MAIIKHKAMKSSDYNAAIEYLEYEHDVSGKTIKDAYGLPQQREHYIMNGINCEPLSFNTECHMVNEKYNKNRKRNEVKSHSYIISFDPRDAVDNGLTLQEVQQFGIEFVNNYLPGYQAIVCSHADGSNGSRNLHCHIVINSIRMESVKREPYMDQFMDNLAGGKHRCTPEFERFVKAKVMEMCQERGLYQVNLLEPSKNRINDREYYLGLHGKLLEGESFQTRKEYIRSAVRDCAGKSNHLDEFRLIMESEYGIRIHESRGRYSYILPDRERGITDRQLGSIYTRAFIEKVMTREEVYFDRPDNKRYQTNDYVTPDLKKLVDISSNEKAQQSKGYEHAVMISNLKKTAETINLLSERGLTDINVLNQTISSINNEYSHIKKELKSIERQIAELKNVVDLKKEMSRIKPIVNDLKGGKESSDFRKEHETDLIILKAVQKKLKNADPELKACSVKTLSARIDQLLEMKNTLYEQRCQIKKDIGDLENAKYNLLQLERRDALHLEKQKEI